MKTFKNALALFAVLALIGAFSMNTYAQKGVILKEEIIEPNDDGPAPLDINEKVIFEELKIFKSGGQLNCSFSSEENGVVSIKLIDLTGKIIHFSRENKDGAKVTSRFDIGSLPAALYIVHIQLGNTLVARKVYL